MQAASDRLRAIRHRWGFAAVLVASLLFAVIQPLTAGLVDQRSSFNGFFSLLLIAVLVLVFDHPKQRTAALVLSLTSIVGIWLGQGLSGPAGRMVLVVAYLLAAGFFAFALYGILLGIFAKRVSGDAIFGAVCGYLLLGIIWSLLYHAVETATPGAFNKQASRDGCLAAARMDSGTLTYFSFVTLATVGYGDVTPATPLARTLAWTEAVAGQFYLAILVAGIVGFKVQNS
jgi:hypothetical protein